MSAFTRLMIHASNDPALRRRQQHMVHSREGFRKGIIYETAHEGHATAIAKKAAHLHSRV